MIRPAIVLILFVFAAHAQEAARPGLVNEREVMTQLQIFLDQQLFGPGKIDGRGGEFTTKALWCYQRAHGLPPTGRLDANIPLDSVFPVYTEYTIREEDLKFVGDLPAANAAKEKLKYLPYDCVLEFLTERFHCDPKFLVQLNPSHGDLMQLKAGDVVRVPNVEEFKIEELPKQGSMPRKPEYLHRTIKISRKHRLLELRDGDALIASVPITPGSEKTPTPAGNWKIAGIAAMPNFRWDEGVLNFGVRTDESWLLPPGPNNPVGVLWCQLNKPGIGIHGTNSPQTIGRSASHGCMRVANWDVVRLEKMITAGMQVVIE
ncbi:MAG: L,D-transpeptidase family protein [Chthoniobacteraceae bacterium]